MSIDKKETCICVCVYKAKKIIMTSAYENYASASFAHHYATNDGNGNDQVNGYLNYYHNFPTSTSMMNAQAMSPYNYYSEYPANLFSTTSSSGGKQPDLPAQLPCDDVSTTSTASTQSSHYHYNFEYHNQNYNNNKSKVSTYWNQFNTKMAINYQMQQQQQYQQQQEYPAASYAKDSNYNILSGDNKVHANIGVPDQFSNNKTECNQILNDRKLFAPQMSACEKVWPANESAVIGDEHNNVKDYTTNKTTSKRTDNGKLNEHTDSPALRALLTNPEKKFKHDINYFYQQYRKTMTNPQHTTTTNFHEAPTMPMNLHLNITTPPLSPAYSRRPDDIDSVDSPLSHDWMGDTSGKISVFLHTRK